MVWRLGGVLEASISVGGVSSNEVDGEKDDDFVDVVDASSACSDDDVNLLLLVLVDKSGETKAVTSCRLPAAVSSRIKREALFFIAFCWLS